jgi:hypothetical protein
LQIIGKNMKEWPSYLSDKGVVVDADVLVAAPLATSF